MTSTRDHSSADGPLDATAATIRTRDDLQRDFARAVDNLTDSIGRATEQGFDVVSSGLSYAVTKRFEAALHRVPAERVAALPWIDERGTPLITSELGQALTADLADILNALAYRAAMHLECDAQRDALVARYRMLADELTLDSLNELRSFTELPWPPTHEGGGPELVV